MNWLKKCLTHGLSKKTLLAILVLAAVDIFSMAAPYYLKYVIPDIYKYLDVSQREFDQLNAVLGYVVLAVQIPSGIIADKMSGKKLLIVSVVMSGICTILFGLGTQRIFPKSSALILMYIVFAGFGISTTLFLWAPLWKVLSQQGNAKQQSSLYGLEGSYNGILGLIFITLIGTIATNLATKHGDNSLFYALIYIIAGALFVSGIGIHFFIEETHEKSKMTRKFSEFRQRLWSFRFTKESFECLRPAKVFRVWLLAIFSMGMYMFESVFAYYLKNYIGLVVSATMIAALGGFRAYGLRVLVSGPFGIWMKKRVSWVFTLVITLAIGLLMAIIIILMPGINNSLHSSKTNTTALAITFPILFTLMGAISWFIVVGRYIQIDEVPHTRDNYGTTVALISFVAFSTDAWFYQMASSWAKSDIAGFHTMVNGKWSSGYSQHGLQLLLLTASGISGFGLLCGILAYAINRYEVKKLKKNSHRWRTEEAALITKEVLSNEKENIRA